MKILFYILTFSAINSSFSQTYTHPTVGIGGEFVGSCLEATCSGTYYDNGGAGGNYSNNINQVYRVFCPDSPLNCVSVTFTSFDTEFGFDYLTVGNGPNQNSTVFTTAPADGLGRIWGTPATPFTYTSTHPSGCLTFRFRSDFSVTRPGWAATLSCTPCAAGPTGTTNADCTGLTEICTNAAVPANSVGPGIVAEGCSGTACPAGGENQTNWYAFQIATSGTLALTIAPTVGTDDYDFALFGPNVDCSTLGNPIRCSDSGAGGLTGMANGFGDNTEDVTGDGGVEDINVIAGEIYVLMVDEWTPTGAGYNLNFTGTATFDCTPLPISLTDFYGTYNKDEDMVDLFWTTQSEMNNNYFDLEVSYDNEKWEKIATAQGTGNSAYETKYLSYDTKPRNGNNYYRLKQVDFDGKFEYSKTISVYADKLDKFNFIIQPNPTESNATIVFEIENPEIVILNIYNYSGNLIETLKIDVKNGTNSQFIDLSSQPNGVYLIQLATSLGNFQSKLIKHDN